YIDALAANPDIQSAGVYNETGALAAGFSRGDAKPPARAPAVGKPSYRGGQVEVTSAVTQGGSPLGVVYLRTAHEPMYAALSRHTGVTFLVLMAFLLV